jgi:tRNA(Ile)-lysidine synthase
MAAKTAFHEPNVPRYPAAAMTSDSLVDRVEAALRDSPGGALHVAFSGGLDSSVLLDLLAASGAARARGLHALHVDHGLHADSPQWATHCRKVAGALDVPIIVVQVHVDHGSGLGLEAAARAARHAVFEERLAGGGLVALAQHREDQAETVLLKLLRGAGPDGLGAIRELRGCGAGWLWRPLLDVPRGMLREYALRRGLDWIEDPSNATHAHERNFLRLEILPRLRERWPAADRNLAHAATRSSEAADVIETAARPALAALRGIDPASLPIAEWLELAPALRDAALRRWLRELGLPAPSRDQAGELARQLATAHGDRMPLVTWSGAELRRYRGRMYAMRPLAPLPRDWQGPFDGTPLALPGGLGTLRLVDGSGAAVRMAPILDVRFRRGGERLRLPGRAHRSELRDLFQQSGVPPWQRDRLPLLVDRDGEALAVAGHWIGVEAQRLFERLGCRLDWRTGAH